MVISLARVKSAKGFDMSKARYICFDEFIPQATEVVRRKEGEAFADFIMTALRDKVKRGQQLQVIMFANSEDISTPITNAFEIVDDMAEMVFAKQNIRYIKAWF